MRPHSHTHTHPERERVRASSLIQFNIPIKMSPKKDVMDIVPSARTQPPLPETPILNSESRPLEVSSENERESRLSFLRRCLARTFFMQYFHQRHATVIRGEDAFFFPLDLHNFTKLTPDLFKIK